MTGHIGLLKKMSPDNRTLKITSGIHKVRQKYDEIEVTDGSFEARWNSGSEYIG